MVAVLMEVDICAWFRELISPNPVKDVEQKEENEEPKLPKVCCMHITSNSLTRKKYWINDSKLIHGSWNIYKQWLINNN